MTRARSTSALGIAQLGVALFLCACVAHASSYDVRKYGATGDGKTLDTPAINKAIEAASAAGGGTVEFPAGTYVSGSIRLKSHIALYLDAGATIEASADPKAYDDPEPNEWDKYQDFGHSHFRNSLIWGDGLEDVSIMGPGRIYGKGLVRNAGGRGGAPPTAASAAGAPGNAAGAPRPTPNNSPAALGPGPGSLDLHAPQAPRAPGRGGAGGFAGTPGMFGNKAIALKLSRNVIIRDVTILMAGHFGILATGVDNLTIDNVKIDTNRDGIDIDACRHVRISNASVNAPFDDAIVIKSSYALGYFRDVEDLTITNCQVSGYDPGTFLDGTYKTEIPTAPDREGSTGRIKLGTESSGGFKNVTISNCVFTHSRGLALETVDGGVLEDVSISNITMRDVTNSPIFLRLGSRQRSPDGTPIGAMRRIDISHVIVYDADPRQSVIISGIPGHPIEDVTLSDIRIVYRGGATAEHAALDPPENEGAYPEPRMFGVIPAYGFFLRHVKGLALHDIDVSYAKPDARPALLLVDVQDARIDRVKAQHAAGAPVLVMKNTSDVTIDGVKQK